MSARIVLGVALLCASFTLAAAAPPAPSDGPRWFASRLSPGSAHSLSDRARAAVWPPKPLGRLQPQERPRRPERSLLPGDAFMVDTSIVPSPMITVNIFFGAASNGDGFRVLWHDGNLFRTSGIGPDGSLHDNPGVVAGGFSPYLHSVETRQVTATGEDFVAVWTGDTNIGGAILDSTGQPVDSFLVFMSDSGQAEPAVAFDGDSTSLVVWTESPNGDPDVYAARVTLSGRVLDSVPIHVADDSIVSEANPCVAYGQGVYLVAWTASDVGACAKAVRVSREGAVLDTAILLRRDSTAMQAYPTVAFGDTCFFAAWSEGLSQPDIFAARISASGAMIDSAVQLTDSPEYEMFSSAAFDGTRYLAMWNDMDITTYNFSLGGRRLSADCIPLDSTLIRPQVPGFWCVYPGVTADGANFLVGFTVQDTIAYSYGACCMRVSPEGVVLDSGIFVPMGADAQIAPSVATDGTDYLVSWLESRGVGWAVSAARIAADGTVLDPSGFLVATTAGSFEDPTAAAFGDSLYLVAWDDQGGSASGIYCARVTIDGRVLDPDGLLVCSDTTRRRQPQASFDGENFLVVWQDYRSLNDYDIYAARVSPAGNVIDPNGFPVDVSDKYDDVQPSVCYAGPDYLVAWSASDMTSREADIHGALVSPDGGVTQNRFVISAAPGDQQGPAVRFGQSSALVAWEDSRESDPDVYAARVRADGTVLDTAGFIVAASGDDDNTPRIATDADGFRVALQRWNYVRDSSTFVVARVDTTGEVVRTTDWFTVPFGNTWHDVANGSGPDLFLVFSSWADSALGREFRAVRLWGRLGEVPGIELAEEPFARNVSRGASVIRGVLFLPPTLLSPPSSLLSVDGRKVMELQPGANDVRGLSPGIYFVRQASSVRHDASSVAKVVVTR